MTKYIMAVLVILVAACNSTPDYTPKPRTFPKVEFPERTYEAFGKGYCDFDFKKPAYVNVEQDKNFLNERPLHPCWFDLVYPMYAGRIHCDYTPIKGDDELFQSINDAYELANKHNLKAEYIDELIINNPQSKVYGAIFEIEGSVASPFQFYLTDSTDNFFRGSLYFNTQPNPDSMAPVIDFVKEDIVMMLNSFEWK